jgi:hypothetical protein
MYGDLCIVLVFCNYYIANGCKFALMGEKLFNWMNLAMVFCTHSIQFTSYKCYASGVIKT